MRKSRDVLNMILKNQGGHYHRYRHRSQSVSPGRIKKRNNARRLHFLKELENTARCIWNVSEKRHKHADPGLKGGGRKGAKPTLDLERLASIIIRVSISKESSKKEFWKAVAQNYYKTLTVDKIKVEQLRLVWRRNSGDIRGRVKYVHQREELNNGHSTENDLVSCMDDDQGEPIDTSKLIQSHLDSRNSSNEGSMSHDRKNYIKQENSRKKSSPYWRGHAICKYQDVEVHLRIADKEEGVLEINFSGDVEHDVTQPKAKRITGKPRQKLISEVWKTNNNPSKLHRESLLNIDSMPFLPV
ncbi:Hypothetical predicted protein [Paramuricea clavata]|uniref:Uncharacterized protein n=1 Tax=Paramuricea clavata TaxID=317549 RepID=A0A6S7JCT9_PARCT|nr:Hypothetical predicted protein [Paramuricea clavata]